MPVGPTSLLCLTWIHPPIQPGIAASTGEHHAPSDIKNPRRSAGVGRARPLHRRICPRAALGSLGAAESYRLTMSGGKITCAVVTGCLVQADTTVFASRNAS